MAMRILPESYRMLRMNHRHVDLAPRDDSNKEDSLEWIEKLRLGGDTSRQLKTSRG